LALASVFPTTFGTLHLTGTARGPIVKLRATAGAALKFAFPACEAVIVQMPAAVRWTRAPLIVQRPPPVKETASPELAVALTLKSGLPSRLFPSGAKVIVWDAFPIVNVRAMLGAGE
jgi:hypothetical protein